MLKVRRASVERVSEESWSYGVLGLFCVCHCCIGFSMGSISPAMESVTSHFELSEGWRGVLGASALAGNIVGSPMGGFIADFLGRRACILTSWFVFSLAVLGQGFSTRITQLCFYRSIVGWSVGSHYSGTTAYLSEILPEKSVGRLLSLVESTFFVGNFLSLLLGALLARMITDENLRWRLTLSTSAIPVMAGLVIFYFTANESNVWIQAKVNKTSQLIQTSDSPHHKTVTQDYINKTRQVWFTAATRPESFQQAAVLDEREIDLEDPSKLSFCEAANADFNLSGAPSRVHSAPPGAFGALVVSGDSSECSSVANVEDGWWKLVVFVSIFWGTLIIPTYAVSAFAIKIISELDVGMNVFVFNSGLGLAAMLGVFVGMGLIDIVGKKNLLLMSQWGVAVSFWLMCLGSWKWLVIVSFFFFEILNGMGSPLALVYPAEIFPSKFKGIASGVSAMNSRIMAVLSIVLMSLSLSKTGVPITLNALAFTSALGAIVTHLMAPP